MPSHEAFGSGCYCLLCTEHNNNDDVDQEKVKEWTQGDFVNVSVRRGCRLGQPVLTRLLSRVSNFVLVFQIIFHLCGNRLEEFDGKFNQIYLYSTIHTMIFLTSSMDPLL